MRLQVPVSKELAEAIAELAEKSDRSQCWLAGKILEWTVDDGRAFGKWLGRRALGPAKEGKIGWLQLGGASNVRLQVSVPQEIAERVERAGHRLGHTQVRMAALFLDFGVLRYEKALCLSVHPLMKPFRDLFAGKKPDEFELPASVEGAIA